MTTGRTKMDRVLRAILRTELRFFIRKVFATVCPGEPYLHNWHIEAIAYQLERVFLGETTRLFDQPTAAISQVDLRLGRLCRLASGA